MNDSQDPIKPSDRLQREAADYRTFVRQTAPSAQSSAPLESPAAIEDNARLFEPLRLHDPERWDGMS